MPRVARVEHGAVKVRRWDVRRRRDKHYEFLGGLMSQQHEVLQTTVENAVETVVSRVLFFKRADGQLEKLLTPDSCAVGALRATLDKLTKHVVAKKPLSRAAFVALQNTAAKRKRMQRAMASLNLRPVCRKDAEIQGFGKREKLKIGKPLRMILPRSDEYHMENGRYVKAFEKDIYRSIDHELGYCAVMKGLNGVQRATEVRTMWERFDRPVAVSVDIEKFDASVHRDVLVPEHAVYLNAAGGCPYFKKLLAWQLTNRGRVMCDDGVVSFSRAGGRMSGDANTSLGNILICCAAHVAYAKEQGIDFGLANDGDDSVIILEQRDLSKYLAGVAAFWRKLGFHIKIDGVAYEFSRIDFCQCRPVEVDGVWAFVRNPATALAKDLLNSSVPTSQAERLAWYAAVGVGGLSQYAAVPVFGPFYRMLVRLGRQNKVNYQWRTQMAKTAKYQQSGLGTGVITASTRVGFWEAFGITPDVQRCMEQRFDEFQATAIPRHHGTPPVTAISELLKL